MKVIAKEKKIPKTSRSKKDDIKLATTILVTSFLIVGVIAYIITQKPAIIAKMYEHHSFAQSQNK